LLSRRAGIERKVRAYESALTELLTKKQKRANAAAKKAAPDNVVNLLDLGQVEIVRQGGAESKPAGRCPRRRPPRSARQAEL
jgi:hypothetical protein